MNGYIVEKLIVISNYHILVNHTERADDIAVTKLCFGIYYG